MPEFNQVLQVFWLLFIGFLGGCVGFITKVSKDLRGRTVKESVKKFLAAIFVSLFTAYTSFFIFLKVFHNEVGLSIALSGIMACLGTDVMIVLQKHVIALIERKFNNM